MPITFDPTNSADDITFGILGSNQSYVAQFGSTTSNTFMGIYANDPYSNTGYILGVSNVNVTTPIFQISLMSSNGTVGSNLVLRNNLAGINTLNPNYTLDVNGDINFVGALYQSGSKYIGSQWITSNTISQTGSNTIYIIGSNIGIGTAVAQSNLHVQGNAYISNNLTTCNINFTGSLFQNGIPYIASQGSQWITSNTIAQTGSNSIYITGSNIGIGTAIAQSNLDVWGTFGVTINNQKQFGISSNQIYYGYDTLTIPFISSTTLNVSTSTVLNSVVTSNITSTTITTQNNIINAGSGALTVGTINTQGSTINVGTITSTTITTQNNIINAGSGALTVGTINTQGAAITVGTITTQNYAINAGSGALTVGTITTQNNSINAGSGSLIASNINFSGQLLQNGSPYIGSQWTTSLNTPAVGSNSIYIINCNVGIGTTSPQTTLDVWGSLDVTINGAQQLLITSNSTTFGFDTITIPYVNSTTLTTTDINFTGQLLQNGVPYISQSQTQSQWTTALNIPSAGSNSIYIINCNVGIGTTNPQANLHVVGTTILSGTLNTQNNSINIGSGTLSTISLNSTNFTASNINTSNIVAQFITVTSNEYIFGNTYTSKIIINDSGIFTSQPTNVPPPVICAAITCTTITTQNNSINVGSGTVNANNITINQINGQTYQSNPWNYFNTSNLYYAPAAVSIGASNNLGYTLYVGNSNNLAGTIGAYGNIYAFLSDERLKQRIGPIENALTKLCSIDGFRYIHNETARSHGYIDNEEYVGVSAQQVQKVLPEVVKPAPFDADNHTGQNYLTVQYERIVPLLIESIKELRKEVIELQKEVYILKNKS